MYCQHGAYGTSSIVRQIRCARSLTAPVRRDAATQSIVNALDTCVLMPCVDKCQQLGDTAHCHAAKSDMKAVHLLPTIVTRVQACLSGRASTILRSMSPASFVADASFVPGLHMRRSQPDAFQRFICMQPVRHLLKLRVLVLYCRPTCRACLSPRHRLSCWLFMLVSICREDCLRSGGEVHCCKRCSNAAHLLVVPPRKLQATHSLEHGQWLRGLEGDDADLKC